MPPPPPPLPPPSLSMNPDPTTLSSSTTASDQKVATTTTTSAIATRSRASLVDVDLSFAALDATSPVYPGLRACDRCRERKVRCDRKSPRCTICIKRDEVCITTPLLPHQRGGKPLPEPESDPYGYDYGYGYGAPVAQPQPQETAQKEGALASSATTTTSSSELPRSGPNPQKRTRTRTTTATASYDDMGMGDEMWAASSARRTRRSYAGTGADDDDDDDEALLPTTTTTAAKTKTTTSRRRRTATSNSPPAPVTTGDGGDGSAGARPRRRQQRTNPFERADKTGTIISPSGSGFGFATAAEDYTPATPGGGAENFSVRPRGPRHASATPSSYARSEEAPTAAEASSSSSSSPAAMMVGPDSPASYYSVSSSIGTSAGAAAGAAGLVLPPRIYAPVLMTTSAGEPEDGTEGEEAVAIRRRGAGAVYRNAANGKNSRNGDGAAADMDRESKMKMDTRRALSRVLVEGREAPFHRVRSDGRIDLARLISQVELCDAAYAPSPPPPPPPPAVPPIASASTSSSTSSSARNLATEHHHAPASSSLSRPAPLFSTSRTAPVFAQDSAWFRPNAHQAHMCVSTYFSRLEPALELFLPGPTVAHRFLQECNALWTADGNVGEAAAELGPGAQMQAQEQEETEMTLRREREKVDGEVVTRGWTSVYLATLAMGAMAMTEVEWASIGCTEDKVRAGAAWLEEAGRLLVENGFARKPTLETFRASLLILQSCLIGLNGPPDIPLVLESLPMITAAAFELGLHVEPAPATSSRNGQDAGGTAGGIGGNEADERRALWWRLLELQVCWAPLLDRQLPLDPASFSTLPPPFMSLSPAPPFPAALSPHSTRGGKRRADEEADAPAGDDPTLLHAQQQQQQQHQYMAAVQALASLHAVLEFSCRAYHAATAPRPLRPRELDKLSQRLLDLVESLLPPPPPLSASHTTNGGASSSTSVRDLPAIAARLGDPARSLADLLLDVEVCRLQALADEVGGPKDPELEELWNVHAARLVSANPLAGPQVSHTLAITIYLHGLLLVALRVRGDRYSASPFSGSSFVVLTPFTPTGGMSSALETLRTAPWPLPLHQVIQRGIAVLEAVL
ncbi:hypothetical protein JCM3774_001812 [Rhodotorula dairenensis]